MRSDLRFADRELALTLAGISVLIFAFAARLRYSRATLAGDEPHYLIINLALQRHGSIDVMPIYVNRGYASFYPGILEPHISPGPRGPLPLHNIGGPLLWHLPYLAWGRAGAAAFIVVVSALTVYHLYYFLREMGIVAGYAGLVTAAFAIGSPLYVYSSMLFIEPVAALGVLYAMRVLCRSQCSGWRLAVASTGLGILPWVHGRFILLSVTIAALLAWRVYRETGWRRPARYAQALAPLSVLLLGLEVFNLVVWNSLSIAPNMTNYGAGVLRAPVTEGLLGLLLDRSFGLIPNFPLCALVFAGVAVTASRRTAHLHLYLAAVVLPYLAAVATFEMWWGGYSPPARYLAPVAPLLAYYVAALLQRVHHWTMVVLCGLLATYALTLAVIGDVDPRLRWNWHEWEPARALRRLGELIGLPVAGYVPSSFLPAQARVFAAWIVMLAVATAVLWLIGRRAPRSRMPEPASTEPPA